MVSLENYENQNADFDWHLLKHKVYQSISIKWNKTCLPLLIVFSSLPDINTTLKIGITIKWSFTWRYVIAKTSLWCWKEISYNDVPSISIRSRSLSRWKSHKKPMSPQYRVPTGMGVKRLTNPNSVF